MHLIRFAQTNARSAHMKETPDRLSLSCDRVDSIGQAIDILRQLTEA